MEQMQTWEAVLVGIIAVLLIFVFRPGIKQALQQSREAEEKDWKGALVPIGFVLLFVILLIALA